MKTIVDVYLREFKRDHRRRLRFGALALFLALLVTVGISWRLRYTGIALTNETYCGLTEHTHTDECYEKVLVCGLEEAEGHSHTDACYEEEPVLICGLEESAGHTHTESCYDEEGNLVCGLEEAAGHTHNDDCYETRKTLVCGQEESVGHTHTDECYETVLICELEEHTHTAECMTDETADVETASDWESTIPELTENWTEDVVAVAQSQIGYVESTANFVLDEDGETLRGYTRYGAWYGNMYGNWDAMFVSFCLYYADVPEDVFPEASGAYAWAAALQEKSLYQSADAYVPSAGDLVFFDRDDDGKADHVGILEKADTQTDAATGEVTVTKLYVIEGDYSADSSDAADAVTRNEYNPDDVKSRILGYGTLPSDPRAEEAETETETDTEIAIENDTEMALDTESDTGAEGTEADGTGAETATESDGTGAETATDPDAGAAADAEDSAAIGTGTKPAGEDLTENETNETALETEASAESETESELEGTGQSVRVYSRDDVTVTVCYGAEAEISDGAALMVSEYTQDSELWQSRYAEAAAFYGWEAEETETELSESGKDTEKEGETESAEASEDIEDMQGVQFRLFSAFLYEDGQKLQPADGTQVQVTIEVSGADDVLSCEILSFCEGEVSGLTAEYSYDEDTQTQMYCFSLSRFSEAGIGLLLQTDTEEEGTEETAELTTQSVQGEDYIITVSYGPEAELPEEAVLMVSEYDQDSEEWQVRYEEAAALYGWEDGTGADTDGDAVSETDESAGNADAEVSAAEETAETSETTISGETSETGEAAEISETSETDETSASETEAAADTEVVDYRKEFRLFKIGFYVDGEEVEPAADVTVTILYLDKDGEATYNVTHFSENGTKDVAAESGYEENVQTITFDTDGFSEYGISTVAETETETETETEITYSEVTTFYLWIKDYNNNTVDAYSEWETGTGQLTASGVLSYTESGETYYLIPISYFTTALSSYGYTFDGTNTDFCPFMYIPSAYSSGVSSATGEASYVEVNGSWYVRVQDTTGSNPNRSNVYYMMETVSTFRVWPRTAVGTTAMGTYEISTALHKVNTTYYYIPVSDVKTWFTEFSFDENDLDHCPFYYAPDANYGSANLTQANYVYMNGSWYLEIQDTGTYGDPPRSNLYYLSTDTVVLNLGNGNGSAVFNDYSGANSINLRYTTASLSDYADANGTVTIHLPSDSDLGASFVVVDEDTSAGLSVVSVTLGQEAAYDYKLVGWINIATGEYYCVEDGSTTAEVDLSNANVFYADWIAESYDVGSSSDSDLISTADTSSFVKIYMFDYNELFNLYSASLTQTGVTAETWADSGNLYETPLLGNDADSLTRLAPSFLFANNGTGGTGVLANIDPRKDWNNNHTSSVTTYDNFEITSKNSAILQKLFDTSAGNTGDDLGVYYVGEANYLFSYDDDPTSSTYGYYSYDSSQNAAAYNQTESRFYVYSSPKGYGGSGFYPYNSYSDSFGAKNGTINEWFGMNVELDFYLPNAPGSGTDVNQVNGTDMVFEFSGDDDVWVFVDDELVLDLGGIHGALTGTINFATGEVTVNGTTYTDLLNNISSGTHRLSIYYMERGGWASNLKLSFNTIPKWEYETATAGTISVTKEWGTSTATTEVTMGLFERMEITGTTSNTDGTTTYTVSAASYLSTTTYTVQSDGYSYDANGVVQAYYSGGYLYVLVDTQVLNDANGWTYIWGLLDSSKTYEVLELTTLSHYTTSYESETLQIYDYWSVIGTDDLQEMLAAVGYSKGDSAGTIVLSDGAINYESTDQFGRALWGYVIAAGDGTVSIEQVLLSQPPTDNGSDTYIYGAMSDDIDVGAIPDTAKWEMIITGTREDDSVTTNPQRYTFYLKNGDYYLRVTGDSTNGYSLTVTTDVSEATDFYYNSLGELRVNNDLGIRVILQKSNGTVSAVVTTSRAASDSANIKVYYETPEATTKGAAYTVTNEELPAVYLKKVSASDISTTLSGASFALYKISDDGYNTTLYYFYDSSADVTTWDSSLSAEQAAQTTDGDGWIGFYYLEDGDYYLLETAAPDGYNPLTSVIKFTVTNGVVTAVTDENGNTLSTVTIEANTSGNNLIVQVQNKTEEILPSTGGFGAAPYYLAGVLLLGGSAALFGRRRRYAGRSPNG
ncbi:MAG: fibro-slime domain-containing protein [Lachnospiraceae bacterium]|nr:fibro-slime domain-containing protein [Lachnospiraceae bacterium]